MYFIVGKADGHIEEKNGNKYLVFDSADKKKEVLKNTQNFGMGLRILLKKQIIDQVNMEKIS